MGLSMCIQGVPALVWRFILVQWFLGFLQVIAGATEEYFVRRLLIG